MNIVLAWLLGVALIGTLSLCLGIYLAKHSEPCEQVLKFQSARASIRAVHRVQGDDGNWNSDAYMRGLFNGLELALATLENRDPEYRDKPPRGYREDYTIPMDMVNWPMDSVDPKA